MSSPDATPTRGDVPPEVWDAAMAVIQAEPRDAWENARTWRAVYAALRAAGYEAEERGLLPPLRSDDVR